MKDQYGREIEYMRISVTDRCNLRCRYCMPEGGISTIPMEELLSYEEIETVCRIAADMGIRKIRLTGGEPLVRLEVAKLVRMLRQIDGIDSVTMTTNGILLKQHLDELLEAGLSGVNISLDTLDPERFRNITGVDALDQVLDSIHACLDRGLQTKVNTVLIPDDFFAPREAICKAGECPERDRGAETAAENWWSMLELARTLPVDLRFIELMPIGEGRQYYQISGADALQMLKDRYPELREDHTVHGSGPAVYYKIPGFAGTVGMIQALHGKFCAGCNRIRMSATGKIKPCLCYADTFDLKPALRRREKEEVRRILSEAIYRKPSSHCFEEPDEISEDKRMVSIGG